MNSSSAQKEYCTTKRSYTRTLETDGQDYIDTQRMAYASVLNMGGYMQGGNQQSEESNPVKVSFYILFLISYTTTSYGRS